MKECMRELKAYKAAMQQNGLNIDDLQAENTQIINQLYRLTQSDSTEISEMSLLEAYSS